jgi:hypothetical protein
MNDDPFIDELRRQPFKSVPPQWKTEILGAAMATKAMGATACADSESKRKGPSLRAGSAWLEWLWPHPAAWAGLAAVWLLILGVNAVTVERSDKPTRAAIVTMPALDVQKALAAQRLMLQELLELDTAWNQGGTKGEGFDPRDPADARPRSAVIPEMAHA